MLSRNNNRFNELKEISPRYSIRKFTVGAASVLIGMSIFGLNSQTARADSINENDTNKQNPAIEQKSDKALTATPASDIKNVVVTAKNVDAQNQVPAETSNGNTSSKQNTINTNKENSQRAELQIENTRKVVAANKEESTQDTTAIQNQAKPVAKENYSVIQHDVIANNGNTPHDSGYVQLNLGLQIKNTKNINPGDYIDIDLGLPLQSGQQKTYSDGLAEKNTPVTIKDNAGKTDTIGSIATVGNIPNEFYRLSFNDHIQKYGTVLLNLDLKQYSLIQRAISTVGYSHEKNGPTSYSAQDDLVIGDGAYKFTSGLSVPVKYIPQESNGSVIQRVGENTWIQGRSTGKNSRVWTVYPDGSFTVNDKSALGLDGIVYFSKNFGNSATVTVYTLSNNPYFDSNYASDDDIKEQIESAFAQLKSTNNLDQIAQDNSNVGFSINKIPENDISIAVTHNDNSEKAYSTVMRADGSKYSGDQLMLSRTYHITVNGAKLGQIYSLPISFVSEITKSGVNVSKPANITKPEQDKIQTYQDSNKYEVLNNDLNNAYPILYKGIMIDNPGLMNFMKNNLATWIDVKNDEDPSDELLGPAAYTLNVSVVNQPTNLKPQNIANGNSSSGQQLDRTILVVFQDLDENNKNILSKDLTGLSGADAGYSTANDIKALEAQHYELVSDDTNGQNLKFGNQEQIFYVKFRHVLKKEKQENKSVSRNITYVDDKGNPVKGSPDGKTSYVQSASFVRFPVKDLVTGVVGYSINNDGAIDTQDGTIDTQDGTHAWKAIGSNYFEKVISKDPASLGFEHVNYAVIPEKTVDANTKDQEIQVIYSGTTKNPDKPSKPSKPDKPETPNKPDKPSEPSKPTKPETPNKPDKPSEPSKPTKPETPNKPDKPSEPSKPDKPETPNKPDKPSQPTKPNKPEVPNKSDKSNESSKPDKTSDVKPTESVKLIHQTTADTSKNQSESIKEENLSKPKAVLDKTSFSPLARRNSPLVNEKTNTLESSKDSTKNTKNRTVNSSKELPQTSSNTQQSINDEVIGSVALSIGLIGLAGVKKRKNAR
ncbi:YSIRK-type signal peptide-containing protein [Lactobacillus paragasseri]|uniref:mucin-binding protein n=1 Tax=Lactobacillus paragasseri TaxID=2107999 RepID=UPI00244660CA|nr:YSIRK-type signal peptide-containing protein [Lactobacillus paragasseri]MDG9742268.1 YSIRK-type signal peptide-containing protein [Lactobacillus paragasseri]